ncbi:hypothetical protein JQC92_04975 [Shewanella sp. 202IG2-18]|uniref:hypothetical protein n=1 Tax=Parashewanella hymeniacidonis TaxID=2807618 RepID=UPI001961CA3A|nr:hypothetical protein [Parashewanella hymeniacidonis]MBM7071393.1 hypothetical protein [Parashewanella hymeniacidonis]
MKFDYLWQILFILLGAFASAYAGYYYANQPEEDIVLEYQEFKNKNLKKVFGETKAIKIFHGEKEIEALGNVRFSILNNSSKNIDKFKVYFEVNNADELPLFHSLTSPDSYPKEAVTLISKNEGVYIFEVEYLNRTKKRWDSLDFVFYFADATTPKVHIKTGTKGVVLKKYEYKEKTVFEIILGSLKRIWWVLLAYSFLIYFLMKRANIRRKLHKKKIDQILIDTIEKDNDLTSEQKIEKINEVLTSSPKFSEVMKHWKVKFE